MERQNDMIFTIRLADVSIEVKSIFDRVYQYCRDYLCDETPKYSVEIVMSDIECERENINLVDLKKGLPKTDYSDEYLEIFALHRKVCEVLINENVIMFHGSAIKYENKAILFTAPSGMGKSTHAAIWKRIFGENVEYINDDKPFIKFYDNQIVVFGSPWTGKHKLGNDISATLGMILKISRSENNSIQTLSNTDSLQCLLTQTYRSLGLEFNEILISNLIKMVKRVGIYQLNCNMEDEAAEVAEKLFSNICLKKE